VISAIVDHVGIAVKSLSEQGQLYKLLGLTLDYEEIHPSEGVKIAFYGKGIGRVELLEPIEGSNAIAKFLESHGEGLHHVAISVEDLDKVLEDCGKEGKEVVGDIRLGAGGRRVAFLHPKSAGGVLLELVEVDST
jgi:methylmalonyl-CoA/ethylmalonyl-CoA epimerase